MFTLFPKQPMTPQPIHETLGWWRNCRSSSLIHTVVIMPTICLVMMHLNCPVELSPLELAALSCRDLSSLSFNFEPPLDLLVVDLFNVSRMREFHLLDIHLFSGPRTFFALSGTISWNLVKWITKESVINYSNMWKEDIYTNSKNMIEQINKTIRTREHICRKNGYLHLTNHPSTNHRLA